MQTTESCRWTHWNHLINISPQAAKTIDRNMTYCVTPIQDIMSLFSPSLSQDPKFIYKPSIWNPKIPELTGTVEAFR